MSRATKRDFEAFGAAFKSHLSVALSNSMKKAIGDLDREIAETVRKVFWFPGDPSKLAVRRFETKGARFASASLTYRFEAVSLSKYPMKQIRITVGGGRLKVTRGGGQGGGAGFISRPTPISQTVTMFKLRKSDGWRTVMGRIRYRHKGFLHTGTKGRFASAVFERSQKATWSGGVRQPIHKLYGASLVRLLHSHELQALLKESRVFEKFQNDFYKSLTLSVRK